MSFNALSDDFYPRPLRGGRPCHRFCHGLFLLFLSTPSARRATQHVGMQRKRHKDFYPRPLRGGRPPAAFYFIFSAKISIHALCEEGDNGFRKVLYWSKEFLSTPSARRATTIEQMIRRAGINFYPRPLRGGRLAFASSTVYAFLFLSTPSARRATAKTETKSLFSNKLYNILHEFRRALIYNGSKSYPNHAK